MTSSNGNIFRVTGHLCKEFTGHRWFPHKSQWRGALMNSLICARINGSANNRQAGDLRRHRAHYDVIVMFSSQWGAIGLSSVMPLSTSWWRQGMETFSVLLTFCEGNPPGSSSGFAWQRASIVELRCYKCTSEQAIGQTMQLPMIWDTMWFMWRHCNASKIITIRIFLGVIIYLRHKFSVVSVNPCQYRVLRSWINAIHSCEEQ